MELPSHTSPQPLDAHCQTVSIILTIRCNVLGQHRYTACFSHPLPLSPPSERLQGCADLSIDCTLQIILSIYFFKKAQQTSNTHTPNHMFRNMSCMDVFSCSLSFDRNIPIAIKSLKKKKKGQKNSTKAYAALSRWLKKIE